MSPKSYEYYSQASQDYAREQRKKLAPHGGCNWRGCRECFPEQQAQSDRVYLADGHMAIKSIRPSDQRGDWAVYAFNIRKREWEAQPEFIGVSLEIALTAVLRWKDQGQDVRIETIPA